MIPQGTCEPGEFACFDGDCLPGFYECDGQHDCTGDEDEARCYASGGELDQPMQLPYNP